MKGFIMTTIYFNGDNFEPVALKDVKPGDFLVRKPGAKTVFTKNHYDRASKTYSLSDYEDYNREIFLKGSTIVYVGFTY
jgi:hypothetical protein